MQIRLCCIHMTIFLSFSCATHNETKLLGKKNTVRVPSRMKLTKHPVFLHYSIKFMGISLFVLKYIFISLLLKMINGFSWSANIMASPFKAKRPCFFIWSLTAGFKISPACEVGWCDHSNTCTHQTGIMLIKCRGGGHYHIKQDAD